MVALSVKNSVVIIYLQIKCLLQTFSNQCQFRWVYKTIIDGQADYSNKEKLLDLK